MVMDKLPNFERNKQVEEAIQRLREVDTGVYAHKPAGIAGALSSLDVAESLQFLQLQLVETSKENRMALSTAIDKLIESNTKLAASNDNHANAMKLLTGALVLVGVAQVIITWIKP